MTCAEYTANPTDDHTSNSQSRNAALPDNATSTTDNDGDHDSQIADTRARRANDLRVRALTTMLSKLQCTPKSLRCFDLLISRPGTRRELNSLRIMDALAVLLVRSHEIVAVVSKRLSAGDLTVVVALQPIPTVSLGTSNLDYSNEFIVTKNPGRTDPDEPKLSRLSSHSRVISILNSVEHAPPNMMTALRSCQSIPDLVQILKKNWYVDI